MNDQPLRPPEEGRARLILAAATLACLLPFLGKALHVDDPLFVWCARQIQAHPADFYGFDVNWTGKVATMATVTQNPPLTCYYVALVGSIFGWSEAVLHGAFLLPAWALVWGTFRLARGFCASPLAAALLTIFAPVFLVSSTSIMCDTMMLAFWVWALVFWMDALAGNRAASFCVAALLMAGCSLTKYFGIAMIPLALAYGWAERRRLGKWAAYLLIPLALLAAYQWATSRLYGRGLLFNAVDYAANLHVGEDLRGKVAVGLAFTGGTIIILLTAAPLLWGRRGLVAGIAGTILFALALAAVKKIERFPLEEAGQVKWFFIAQFALYVAAGTSALALAAMDLARQKTAASALLFLWIAGTFVFACAVNWTVSGRNILPMLPAVSIVLLRRLEQRGVRVKMLTLPAAISLVVALLAARADYKMAESARLAAAEIPQEIAGRSGTIWFEGHWGFQYYLETRGGKPLDKRELRLASNDAIIVPLANSYIFPLPGEKVAAWFNYDRVNMKWLTTMSTAAGAGYYSDGWGPLPFVFGHAPPDRYLVLRAR